MSFGFGSAGCERKSIFLPLKKFIGHPVAKNNSARAHFDDQADSASTIRGSVSAAVPRSTQSTRPLIAVSSVLISATYADVVVMRRQCRRRIDERARSDDENHLGAGRSSFGLLPHSRCGSDSPNQTISGRIRPPQPCSISSSGNPEASSVRRSPQRSHRASRKLPCSSSRPLVPARKCSESTFCVASVKSGTSVSRPRDRVVSGVWLRSAMCGVALVVPAPDERRIARESGRRRQLLDAVIVPEAADPAKRRQSRIRGNSRARQHQHRPGALEAGDQLFHSRLHFGGGAGKPPGIQTGGSPVKRIEGTETSRRKQEIVTEDADVLMERVRARNADAFEALYDAHHRLVYGVALRMLGDAPGAEDVTQAVFVKVWTSPELFRGGNFGAWIVRITRNRALDVLRSRATRNEGELPEASARNRRHRRSRRSLVSMRSSFVRRWPSCRESSASRSSWGSLMESRTRKSRGAAAFRWARSRRAYARDCANCVRSSIGAVTA